MTHPTELPSTAPQKDGQTASFIARLIEHHASTPPKQEPDLPLWFDDLENDAPLPEHSPETPRPIPARQLLICLRLAASFGTAEAIKPRARAAAMTIFRGFPASEAKDVADTLKIVLPEMRWEVLRPSTYDEVSKSVWKQFLRDIDLALDHMRPVLILLPAEVALPAHRCQPGVTTLTYAPASAQILLDYLTVMGRKPKDVAGFLNALPGEEALAQLEVTQLVPALRLGLGGDLPARLHA